MISDALGLVFGPIAVHSSRRFSEAMASRRSRWHIVAVTRWILQCVSPVQLLNATVQATSEPQKVHRQEAIVLMQQAIRLLQQKEEQIDPYAKLKNVTGIICVIFVTFCILYTVWDIAAHLFNCIRNPMPTYLHSNPHQRIRKISRTQQLAEIAKAVKNKRLSKDNATIDKQSSSSTSSAVTVKKDGPLSEPPLDDLINTVERSIALKSNGVETNGKQKQKGEHRMREPLSPRSVKRSTRRHRSFSSSSEGSPIPRMLSPSPNSTQNVYSPVGRDATMRCELKSQANMTPVLPLHSINVYCDECLPKNRIPHDFYWRGGKADSVFLSGSFLEWKSLIPMRKTNNEGEWLVKVELLPGHHEYKFIVDSKWKVDALNLPTTISKEGHVTHILHL